MAELYLKSAIARMPARVPIMTNFAERTTWTGDNLDILRGLNSMALVITVLRAGPIDILEHTVLIASRRTPHICAQHFGVKHAFIPNSHNELSQLS